MYEISPLKEHDLYSIWVDSIVSENKADIISLIQNLIHDKLGYREDEFQIVVNGKTKFIKSSAFVERSENGVKLLGTNIDVTSIKETTSKIIKQNAELEKTNLELDQFVYSISHDLRAPLLSIKGLLSLFDDKATDENKQLYLGMIQESVNRLDDTILEILNFSRNSRIELAYESLDIKNEIQKIITDLGYINKTTVELHYEEEANLNFKSDLFRILIILKNLISNAIKYSKESGLSEIAVKVFSDGNNNVIEISDNGIGISEEHLLKIFDMFYRATNKSIGTGLGLYITKEMVQKLGGKIDVRSKLDYGTTFKVILPKK
jgi:signal transduction histidine kinase